VQIQWTFSDGNTGGQGAGGALSATGSVTVNLIQGNTKPIALPEQFETNASTRLQVVSPTILSNDYDPEGTSLTAVLVSGPSRGSLNLQSDGRFTYDPDPSFLGTVGFVYVASDGSLNSDPQNVTITVTAPPSIDTTRQILGSQPSAPPSLPPPSQPEAPSGQNSGEGNLLVQPPESTPQGDYSGEQKTLMVLEAKAELGATISPSREFREAHSGKEASAKSFGILVSEYNSDELSQSLRSEYMELEFVESAELQINLSVMQNQVANTQVIFNGFRTTEDSSRNLDVQEVIHYQFVGREKQKEIEDQNEDLFFQAATPIAVGTAISAGISLHLILTSQIGTVLLSQSTFVVPLDPLTMLDSSAKVKKSGELEDQLFEAASVKKSRSNG
jgi:hypothetical protein